MSLSAFNGINSVVLNYFSFLPPFFKMSIFPGSKYPFSPDHFLTCGNPVLPPFSLIRDLRKQNTRGNVSKISVNHTCYPTSFPGSPLYFEKVPWLRLVTCLSIPTQAAQRVGHQLNFVNTTL